MSQSSGCLIAGQVDVAVDQVDAAHVLGNVAVGRRVIDLHRRTDLLYLAVTDHRDAVGGHQRCLPPQDDAQDDSGPDSEER